jgi:protein-S-isoprenylcysteine O-methyltransferase Ste14
MYAAGLVMWLGIALALGSWWVLFLLAPGVVALAWRLVDEEEFLKKNLPDYAEYARRVRWRLIPGIY